VLAEGFRGRNFRSSGAIKNKRNSTDLLYLWQPEHLESLKHLKKRKEEEASGKNSS